MSDNAMFQMSTLLILILHAGALYGWLVRGLTALIALNVVMSTAVLGYAVSRGAVLLREPIDTAMLLVVAFEAIVLLTAALTRRRRRFCVWLTCTAFTLHCCASVAAAAFAFTFRMQRLM